jgi:4-amino-4-deoxy-L-arabinose transferase-like glycosyltransferase
MMRPVEGPRRARRDERGAGRWVLLFVVALSLRALYALLAVGPSSAPSSDPAEYDTVAWNLAHGGGFSLARAGGIPTAFVPPVVPWLTSLLYRVIGHHYFGAVLLQCVIGATVPLLLGLLGTALFGVGIGLLAAWIAAVHPLLVFFSGYLLTETTFCATLLLALFLTVEWAGTPRPARGVGAGLAWGLAALTRPTALLLPAVVVLWAWGALAPALAPRGRAQQIALLLLGMALVVGPWTLRNAGSLHAFVPVTTGGGRALLDANNVDVWNDRTRRGGAGSVDYFSAASPFRGLSEVELDARARSAALAFLNEHRGEWPAMAAAKLARFWRLGAEGGATGAWQRPGSPLAGLLRRVDPLLAWSLLTLPFALWGLVRVLGGPRRWVRSLPLMVVLFFTLLAVVFWGALRMRVPVEPLISLHVAIGFADLRRRVRERRSGLRVVGA